MKPLYEYVSERAKLYCQPDPALGSCLCSELSHLLPATFVRRYWHLCSHLAQPPAQLVYACARTSDSPPDKEVAPGVLHCMDWPEESPLPESTTS